MTVPHTDPVNGLRPADIAALTGGRARSGTAQADDQAAAAAADAFDKALSGAAGTLATRLPTGAAAHAWARWRPPVEALGMLPPSTTMGGPGGPNSGLSTGALNRALSSNTPGVTGAVFPVAATAGEALVNLAAQQIGSPPPDGFDGAALVQESFGELGIRMPRTGADQATRGAEVPTLAQARPGDVVAFGVPVDHVGLYVGNGRVLHAPESGGPVTVEKLDRPITTIRRVLSGDDVGPAVLRATGTTAPTGLGVLPSEVTPTTDLEAPMTPSSSAINGGPVTGVPYAELFSAAGAQWNVDPALLAAVAQVESAFDPTAVSPAGAQGLMQFMPATAREMNVDPWDPASAIDGAARYLRTSLSQFGEVDHALASYNAGRGAVRRYGGIPPYPETEDYVRKVLDVWRNNS